MPEEKTADIGRENVNVIVGSVKLITEKYRACVPQNDNVSFRAHARKLKEVRVYEEDS